MAVYSLFGVHGNGAVGPATPTNFSGSFISGVTFCVTGEAWFQGYWWWVSSLSGGTDGFQNTTPTKFALWQIPSTNALVPQLVPGSVVTSGTLTAGAWNYVPLSVPLLLSMGGSSGLTPPLSSSGMAQYVAAAGCNGPFPDTNNTWGAAQIYPSGIANGPLLAYSAPTASMPAPYQSWPQGCFSTAGSDPSTTCPNGASNTDNFWLDVQVSDFSGAPSGASLSLWPNFPAPALGVNADTSAAVSATAFSLSKSCTLNAIRVYSATGATGLPTRVGIWNTSTQTEVAGTDNAAPSWSGLAASGWVSVSYTGVTLPAGHYAVAFFNGAAQTIYFDSHNQFFAGTDPVGGGPVGGPDWNGISKGGGILTAPNVAGGPSLVYDNGSGTFPGQTPYTGPTALTPTTTWVYPAGFEASADWGETRWADVVVTPLSSGGGAGAGSIGGISSGGLLLGAHHIQSAAVQTASMGSEYIGSGG